jgi:hypothetical protein
LSEKTEFFQEHQNHPAAAAAATSTVGSTGFKMTLTWLEVQVWAKFDWGLFPAISVAIARQQKNRFHVLYGILSTPAQNNGFFKSAKHNECNLASQEMGSVSGEKANEREVGSGMMRVWGL